MTDNSLTTWLSQENALDINISNNLDAQQTDSQLNNIITLEPYERKRSSEELDSDRKRRNGLRNKERKKKQLLRGSLTFNSTSCIIHFIEKCSEQNMKNTF